jgi:hypothetical protein
MRLRLAIALLTVGIAAPVWAQQGAVALSSSGEATVVPFGTRLPPKFDLVSEGGSRSNKGAWQGCFARFRDPDDGKLYDRPTCTSHCSKHGGFQFSGCTIF